MKKGILFLCAAILSMAAFSHTVYGLEILFEHRTQQQISRGVTYEQNRMMTSNGMLDVHVLWIDLHDQYLYVGPVTSAADFGRRDTTSNMLRDAGAIGGINADFFGLAGQYSVHFGPIAMDGQLLATNASTNINFGEFATFFVDVFNNVSFRYMRSDIRFYNNGTRNVNINSYNNIGHALDWPVVIDRLAMVDTSDISARFPGLSKIVVQGNAITQVSMPGQTVTVPEDGYVIILPQQMAYRRRYFNVGDRATLIIGNNLGVDFSSIQSAIGGGGLILSQGETVNDRGAAPTGRHPRSAVGICQLGRYLILMTVDGRSHSIGATHAEMAEILRRYGAFEAMHFDGGGSSTLVISDRGENHMVANTLSEGSERRVINALGIFDSAPVGEMSRIVLDMSVSQAIVGFPVEAGVFGEDRHWNRLPVNMANVNFSVQDATAGNWRDGVYTALRSGTHILEARYGNYRTVQIMNAYVLAELQPNIPSVSLFEGDRIALGFDGVAVCGSSLTIPMVTELSVTPPHLGHFDNGVFVAASAGSGFITAGIGDIRAYIPVSVGGFPIRINMQSSRIGSLAVPAGNSVNVGIEQPRNAIRMDYIFDRSTATQAAYVTFDPPLSIPGTPMGLRLQVHGNGSGHWLRGRVRDGDGRIHLIDFTRNADFIGWETVTARMPDAPGPFTIDQIYMVTLYSYDTTLHRVQFYGLEAMFAPPSMAAIPQGAQFSDALRGSFANGRNFEFGVPAEAVYSTFAWSGFAVSTMSAGNGGISATDRSQWARFMRDTRAINSEYVLILMDANPLDFNQRMEFELFHLAMQELRNEGRLVFVVSATGEETELTIRDGIRYINLAQPQQGLATIYFSIYGGQIRWRG